MEKIRFNSKKGKAWIIGLILSVMAMACASEKGTESAEALMNTAGSDLAEIVVVIDSTKWAGKIGEHLRSTFQERMPSLPQPEAMFQLRRVSPEDFNDILKNARNLILVSTLEAKDTRNHLVKNYYTPKVLQRVAKEEDFFFMGTENLFAKGQKVMHLFQKEEDLLQQKLLSNATRLQNFFHQSEKEWLQKRLNAGPLNKALMVNLKKKHGFDLPVPKGYRLVQDKSDFIWLRHLGAGVKESDLLIASKPYRSESDFDLDEIIAWRDTLGKQYIWGNDSNSYMLTEPMLAPTEEGMKLDGHYAKKITGLWRLNDYAMGGPFVAYVILDEERQRLFYIEGFVYHPNGKKARMIREVDAILSSFQLVQKVPA